MDSEQDQAIAEAERAGFDLGLVLDALALTHEQRALQHDGALALALEIERARDRRLAHAQPTIGEDR